MAALIYLGGVPYVVDRPESAGLAVTVATPATPRNDPPRLAVVGDSYGNFEWPEVIAEHLGLELVKLSIGGSGYVRAIEVQGSTFGAQVATRLPADADVVLVFGGLNDSWLPQDPLSVGEAARAAFAAVRRIAPGAGLIVAGPQYHTATPPAVSWQHRDAVRAAALEFGATWIDPLAEAWFADPASIGPDGLHPSIPVGRDLIVAHLEPVVADALSR